MMRYKVDEYMPDEFQLINEIRKLLPSILSNSHNSMRFKIKALLVCISPTLTEKIVRYKNKA